MTCRFGETSSGRAAHDKLNSRSTWTLGAIVGSDADKHPPGPPVTLGNMRELLELSAVGNCQSAASTNPGSVRETKLLCSFSKAQMLCRPCVVVGSSFVCHCELGSRHFPLSQLSIMLGQFRRVT